jgi:hypothetical protein
VVQQEGGCVRSMALGRSRSPSFELLHVAISLGQILSDTPGQVFKKPSWWSSRELDSLELDALAHLG